jgi:hypothetical protein
LAFSNAAIENSLKRNIGTRFSFSAEILPEVEADFLACLNLGLSERRHAFK